MTMAILQQSWARGGIFQGWHPVLHNEVSKDMLCIMLTTNNHLGYNNTDTIWDNDSFAAVPWRKKSPSKYAKADEAFSDLGSITTGNEYLKLLVVGSKMEGIQLIGCSCCHHHEGCGWGRVLEFVICSRFLLLEMCHLGTSSGRTFWMQQMVWCGFMQYGWSQYHDFWNIIGGVEVYIFCFNNSRSVVQHMTAFLVQLLWFSGTQWSHISVIILAGASMWIICVVHLMDSIVITCSVHIWIGYSSMLIGYAKVKKHTRSLVRSTTWSEIISWMVTLILVSIINAVLQACWTKHNRCSKDCFWCGTDPYCNSTWTMKEDKGWWWWFAGITDVQKTQYLSHLFSWSSVNINHA